jgi:hypothetical protein|tara:strand:- start:596 stop:1108 length:513 start_codon:yes stop_codon:yes gene_type:complete
MKRSVLDILIHETATMSGYSITRLKSKQQHKTLADARKIGFLAGRLLGIKNEATSWIFGGRSHSTVSVGIKRALEQFKFVEAAALADRVRAHVTRQRGLNPPDWFHINPNNPGVLSLRKSEFPESVFRKKISAEPPKPRLKSQRPQLHVPVWERDPKIAAKRASVIARLG